MANNTVEISQLRVMADYFINATYPYFEELREAFKLLKLTGCRIQEIFDISRWHIISGYQVSLQPQKGNNLRYITLDSTVSNFITAIQNQYSPFLGRTYSQLQYLFNRINPYGKLYSDTKEITNYFYRYLYVRELHAQGLTFNEIADIMGYTSTSAVNNYLNADLTSTYPVPTPETITIFGITYNVKIINKLKIILHDLYSDDGGTGIFKYPLINNFGFKFGYHYTSDAANRILHSLPLGWRMPLQSDMQAISDSFSYPSAPAEKLKDTAPEAWQIIQGNNVSELNIRGTGIVISNQLFYFQTSNFMLSTLPTPPNKQYYTLIQQESGQIQSGPILTEETVYSSVRYIQDIE